MCVIGWNERNIMCQSNNINAALEAVVEVGCGDEASASSGSLVLFSCSLVGRELTVSSSGWHVPFTGVCLNTSSEQVEEGQNEYVQVSNSADMPKSHFNHVDSASVGPFVVPWEGYLEDLSCDTPVIAASKPSKFEKRSGGSYYTNQIAPNEIGHARVRFQGNDMSQPMLTVLGMNSGGDIEPWQSYSSWLCPRGEFELGHLKEGAVDKEQFFADMADENENIHMALRFVGFATLCIGLCCCSGCRAKCSYCILIVFGACGGALIIIGLVRFCATPWPDDFDEWKESQMIGDIISASLVIFGICLGCCGAGGANYVEELQESKESVGSDQSAGQA